LFYIKIVQLEKHSNIDLVFTALTIPDSVATVNHGNTGVVQAPELIWPATEKKVV
jgi:hypothetical protein